MFKFIRKILFIFIITISVITGGVVYLNHRTQSNLNNKFSTVSNESLKKSSDDTNISHDSLKNVDLKNTSTEISKEISSILSNDDNYDIAIKCDDIQALAYLDKNTKKFSMVNLNSSKEYDALYDKTDKYINFDSKIDYSIDELSSMKDEFISADLSNKYKIIKEILSNTDNNLSESDLISIYFQSIN